MRERVYLGAKVPLCSAHFMGASHSGPWRSMSPLTPIKDGT